jgi:hypothetical protein
MGYCMDLMELNFKFKDGKDEQILEAIKSAINSGKVTAWVHESTINNTKNYIDALYECGWEYDEEHHILFFNGEKLGDDYNLFCAIAPYVENGSYIQMIGEDDDIWKWTFENGKCHEVTPAIIWG